MNIMSAGVTGAALLVVAVVTASPTSTPSSKPLSSVRPGFAASDVSFVSAQRGWVLGSGQLLTTGDGGLS